MTVVSSHATKHKEESLKLEADPYVYLLHLHLRPRHGNPIDVYLSQFVTQTWQGREWEPIPWSISGDGRSVDGESTRPRLSLFNAEGIFSQYALDGFLDNATVSRYSVLKTHLDSGVNSFVKNVWRNSRVISTTKSLIVCELRGALDGQLFVVPARQFLHPEFAQVSI